MNSHYKDNSDGTVTDTKTGLMWKRCSEGQVWNGNTCVGEASTIGWDEAMPNDKQRPWPAFAGHDDWRLPDVKEMQSIVDYGRYRPSIDTNRFPNTPDVLFWTASPNAYYSDYSWFVGFGFGFVNDGSRNHYRYAVRLVRGGQ